MFDLEPYMGEIMIVSFNFPPRGWALCNGQLLPINQNQALFSLLGTMYGGDGRVNFALPDFRGRVPVHMGPGFNLAQKGGQEFHTVTTSELPQHFHVVNKASAAGAFRAGISPADRALPDNSYFAENTAETKRFSNRSDSSMANASPVLGVTGGSQPHENRQPYLALNFVIALIGIFPSQN